ncbi:MAG: ribonuclease Z [Bacteroidia bacterium]
MPFNLQILGSSSAVPTRDRNQTALLLDLGSESILFDAGEGVQKQLLVYGIKPYKIRYIVISHLHPDHYIGLIGLLCSWGLNRRNQKLTIISPSGLKDIIDLQLNTSGIELRYEIEYLVPLRGDNKDLINTKHFSLHSFEMRHRVLCHGFLLKEAEHERRIIPERLEGKEIPYEAFPFLKNGKDFKTESGELLKSSELTTEPFPSNSFAYFTDTSINMELSTYLNEVDLLYHDATFLNEIEEKAKETGHSTAVQAARFAKAARVKKLILGHFSSRYGNLEPLEKEARQIFAESHLATEGRIFEVKNK